MELRDATAYCLDENHLKRQGPPAGIVVHRFSVGGAHDASGAARFFRNCSAVGNRMSYSAMIGHDGLVEQCLPDDMWGWHARSHSRTMIAVALFGDFRTHRCWPSQWEAAGEYCSLLMDKHGLIPSAVVGHGELPGGSKYPNHQCPGNGFDMPLFRQYLARMRETV